MGAAAAPSAVRPASYPALADGATPAGRRIGVPRMYINADPDAGTAPTPGIGGRPDSASRRARRSSRCGEDPRGPDRRRGGGRRGRLPGVSNYEATGPEAPTIFTRGLVTRAYLDREILDLSAWSWDDFLAANGDPKLSTSPTSTAR
jgi:amidase